MKMPVSNFGERHVAKMNDSRHEFLKITAAAVLGTTGGGAAESSAPSHRMSLRAAADFNIRDYGATGDGKTLDSPAINRAITAAATAGGGTVRLPAGTYLCYSIRLR